MLDTLFFDFIELGKKLQPKVIIAENVKGLLLGDARQYVDKILTAFDDAGYFVDFTLLDASKMGVPQRRERVFFTAIRKDLYKWQFSDLFGTRPVIDLIFNERWITFGDFFQTGIDDRPASRGKMFEYWNKRSPEDSNFADTLGRTENRHSCFNNYYLKYDEIPFTHTSNSNCSYVYDEYRKPNKSEMCCIGSFPQDYDFTKNQYYYIIGMSVPPVMTAQIATRVYEQWLKGI